MSIESWAQSDYATGLDFIAENEEKVASSTILDTETGVTVIIPTGLPLYGVGLYSAFTLSPILLFILVVAYFLIALVLSGHGTAITVLKIAGVCVFMLWGLGKALQVLFLVRDLFPRKFFTTMGKEGIAMHYSRWHFLSGPKTAVSWKEVESARINSILFLPGLLLGIPKVTVFEITAKNGELIRIPFHPKKELRQSVIENLEKQIQSRSGIRFPVLEK